MSATCQACTAPSPDVFLCKRCRGDLGRMLADLPWWIDRLAEAAVGEAKLGDGGRGGYSPPGLKGDAEVLPKCTCGHLEHELRDQCGAMIAGEVIIVELDEPDEDGNTTREDRGPDRICDCREYTPAVKQAKMRDTFLAAGHVNARASRLFDRVQNTLTTIVRDVCESRGVDLPPSFTRGGQTGVATCHRTAGWLRGQLGAICAGEDAGQVFVEIRALIGDDKRDGEIGRVVNRPVSMRWLGKCPTWHEEKQAICGNELRCRADEPEVYCRVCRRTHNCNRLQFLLVNDLERSKVTAARILELNRVLPEEYRISERTLRRWRKPGPKGEPPKLKARGYVRASDGRVVITSHDEDDEPLYLWSDVRRLRAEKPEGKAKAG